MAEKSKISDQAMKARRYKERKEIDMVCLDCGHPLTHGEHSLCKICKSAVANTDLDTD